VMHRLDSAAVGTFLQSLTLVGFTVGLACGRDMFHRQAEPQPP
jgi:hypothetical protein